MATDCDSRTRARPKIQAIFSGEILAAKIGPTESRLGIADQKIDLFDFVPASVKTKEAHKSLEIDVKGAAADSPVKVFHRPVTDTDYRSVMESVLTNLTAELGRKQ